MHIRVCDDDAEMAEEWVEEIRKVVPDSFDVSAIQEAGTEITKLLNRKSRVEKGDAPVEEATQFDDLDILVVDYDLIHLDDTGGRTTGEGIARLARSYAKCGAIVVMNQFKGPQFDLGMRGHLDSFADINVDAELIGSAPLWQMHLPDGSFDPTTWTPLPDLLAAARALSGKLAEGGFGASPMPHLGLDVNAIAELSDTAFGFLSQTAQTAQELAAVTLRDFLGRYFDRNGVECLSQQAPEVAFDFTAFRLIKWLDRAVLRPMDVLVDAAHLIDRLPFLINGDKVELADCDEWTKAAADPTAHLRWDVLEQFHNQAASEVLARPVFDWYRIANHGAIDALQDDYLSKETPSRFHLAEDTSRFVPSTALTRFRADFHNFGDRRGIEYLQDVVTYGPQRRMRFG